jgi:hypothetical protein
MGVRNVREEERDDRGVPGEGDRLGRGDRR